jgi:hypothetical protein
MEFQRHVNFNKNVRSFRLRYDYSITHCCRIAIPKLEQTSLLALILFLTFFCTYRYYEVCSDCLSFRRSGGG